jgi:hypothetical protein
MFKRNWLGLGRIRSNEGFSVYYGHKSVYYTDQRGTLQIGYEDDLLFPDSLSWMKPNGTLSEPDRALILDRMQRALEWEGHRARLWAAPE